MTRERPFIYYLSLRAKYIEVFTYLRILRYRLGSDPQIDGSTLMLLFILTLNSNPISSIISVLHRPLLPPQCVVHFYPENICPSFTRHVPSPSTHMTFYVLDSTTNTTSTFCCQQQHSTPSSARFHRCKLPPTVFLT